MYYVLTVSDCEPYLTGPFATREERDIKAKEIFNNEKFEHLSWLDNENNELNVGIYTDEDLEEED